MVFLMNGYEFQHIQICLVFFVKKKSFIDCKILLKILLVRYAIMRSYYANYTGSDGDRGCFYF